MNKQLSLDGPENVLKGLRAVTLGCSNNQAQGNDTLNQGSRNRNGEKSTNMKNTLKKRSRGPND